MSDCTHRQKHQGLETDGDDPLITGGTVYSLGRMLLEQGKADEAEPLIVRALEIFEQVSRATQSDEVARLSAA